MVSTAAVAVNGHRILMDTVANLVWFRICKEAFFEDAGDTANNKWTRRESKQSWRNVYAHVNRRDDLTGPILVADVEAMQLGVTSGKELREQAWADQASAASGPKDKVALRTAYKAMHNSKPKGQLLFVTMAFRKSHSL